MQHGLYGDRALAVDPGFYPLAKALFGGIRGVESRLSRSSCTRRFQVWTSVKQIPGTLEGYAKLSLCYVDPQFLRMICGSAIPALLKKQKGLSDGLGLRFGMQSDADGLGNGLESRHVLWGIVSYCIHTQDFGSPPALI